MLISVIIKNQASIVNKNAIRVITSSISKRSFSNSSWFNQNQYKNTSSSSSNNSSITPPIATTSASLNYDSVLSTYQNYHIAVAYQPKDRSQTNLFKKSSNKSELSPSGEDNLFVSKEINGAVAIGVADGVGGWSEAGYDSSAISRQLCNSMRTNFENNDEVKSPKNLLNLAFENVKSDDKVEIGGTTACLGILTPDLKLTVANLGDSWCGLFRDYKLIQETNFQTHNFNTPYQLAKIPSSIIKQAELQGRRYIIDSPNQADEYSWQLQKNDIVMFATDGVTDNIIPKDIEIFLKDNETNEKLDDVAEKFVKEVVKVSKDSNFPSAFAQELSRLTGQKYLGGKEDDVTVVLIKVV